MSYQSYLDQLRGGPRPSRPVHQTINGYRTLHETSQGRIFDLPPEEWIPAELVKYGSHRATGKTKPPSLQGPLHPVFARACWGAIGDKRYDALLPSMYLASKLIALSGAAYASFLPNFKRNTKRKYRSSAIPLDDLSPNELSNKAIKAAVAIFDQLAPKHVNWCEDNEMFQSNGWWGINMPGNANPPFDVVTADDWADNDEVDGVMAGDKRQITIGIAAEFADTILKSEKDSEPYTFATFYCAITMVHELGHWLSTHVVRANDSPADGEPYFADAVEMEAGNSYIGWLFGGFRPDLIIPKDFALQDLAKFEEGLCWLPVLECRDTKPTYITRYSMSIDYIERLMSEESWAPFMALVKTNPGLVRRYMLFPSKFRVFETARTAKLDQRMFASEAEHLAKIGDKTYITLEDTPFSYVDLYWSERSKQSASLFNLDTSDVDKSLRAIRKFVADLDELKGKRIELEQQKIFEQNQQARLYSASQHQQLRIQPQFDAGVEDEIGHNQDQQTRAYQDLTIEVHRLGSLMGRTDLYGSVSTTGSGSVPVGTTAGRPITLSSSDEKKPISLSSSSSSSARVRVTTAVESREGDQSGSPLNVSSSSSRGRATNISRDILPAAPQLASLPRGFRAVIAHIKDMRRHPESYPDLRPDVDLLNGGEDDDERIARADRNTGRSITMGSGSSHNPVKHERATAAFEDEEDEPVDALEYISNLTSSALNIENYQGSGDPPSDDNATYNDNIKTESSKVQGKAKGKARAISPTTKSSPKTKVRHAAASLAKYERTPSFSPAPPSTFNFNLNPEGNIRTSPAPRAKPSRRGSTPLASIEPPIKFEGGTFSSIHNTVDNSINRDASTATTARSTGIGAKKRQKTTARRYVDLTTSDEAYDEDHYYNDDGADGGGTGDGAEDDRKVKVEGDAGESVGGGRKRTRRA